MIINTGFVYTREKAPDLVTIAHSIHELEDTRSHDNGIFALIVMPSCLFGATAHDLPGGVSR